MPRRVIRCASPCGYASIDENRMNIFMWLAMAIVGALAWRMTRRRVGSPLELGSVSDQWIAEHRVAETHHAR